MLDPPAIRLACGFSLGLSFSFGGADPEDMLMQAEKENILSFAFGAERISGMDRGDLANLTAFVAVADQRSFRAAASRLDVTPSALSHSMRQLEGRLGVRLLNRTTRSVSVTDAGQRLLERLRPAIDQIAGALENLDEERLRPVGWLRIYATNHLAAAGIVPVWERFLSTHPEMRLELHAGDGPIDIVAKGFDAGIGPRDQVPADMIAVRAMGPTKLALVGAPAYFARRSPPRTVDELARHSCVQYRVTVDSRALAWPLLRNGTARRISVDGRVMVNDAQLATRAAVDGLGIALTTEALAEPFLRSGQLVRVLKDCSPSFEGYYVYYPGRRQVPTGLRAFIDMIRTSSSKPAKGSLENPFAAH
jgi:DNA-binding transcriptional LysR family regulator